MTIEEGNIGMQLEETISTTGTVRDVLEELKDQDVVIVIPIGGDADEFK